MSLKQPGRSQAVNKSYDPRPSVAGRPGPEGGQPGARQGFRGLEPGAGKEGGGSPEGKGSLSTGCAVQPRAGSLRAREECMFTQWGLKVGSGLFRRKGGHPYQRGECRFPLACRTSADLAAGLPQIRLSEVTGTA